MKHTNKMLLVFIAPALLFFTIFQFMPVILGFYYSLTDWNGLSRTHSFVGLDNFRMLVSDIVFWDSFVFTLRYVVVMVILSNVIALLLALLVESRRRSKGTLRVIFYMPNMISMIVGGLMWNFIFTRVVFYMADNWGWSFLDRSWIGNPDSAFIAIIIVSIWGSAGYLMLIYMAALQGVPTHLKEAATLDGASPFRVFRSVTLPFIMHAVTICIFLAINSNFQVFDVIFSLTGGGPGRATQSVSMNIFNEAFRGNIRFGYATAQSTVVLAIVFMITIVQLAVMKRRELES